MVRDVKKESLENLCKINHCLFLSPIGTVYKDCEKSHNNPGLLKERLEYMNSLSFSNGISSPLSLLRDENIFGYEMEFLKDYLTYIDYIVLHQNDNHSLSFEQKREILMNQIKCLKDINKYYAISDISLSNIMINPKRGSVIIDWENGTPNLCDYPTLTLYSIPNCNNKIQEDAIKMFICVLSLLYEMDFESLFENMSVLAIENILKDFKVDNNIISYLNDAAYELIIGSGIAIYFDEYLRLMKPVSERKRILAQKGVKSLYNS